MPRSRRRSRLRWVALSTLLGCAGLAGVARATPASERYSAYEQETLDLVLEDKKARVDPAPEGKRIRSVEIVVLDVIEERDPLPNFLNWFHANTRDYVIERELLFSRGEKWEQMLVSESERNLRNLRQESLVIIVPLQTDDPDAVTALVIAKDVWSLRLNSDYRIRGGELEYFLLQPSEENVAGTHRRISAQFIYEPDTLSFGGRFLDPRLAGSRILYALDGNVIVNQETGEPEGSFGFFQYGLPLYSTRQKWSWGAAASWRNEVTRRHIGTQLATFDAENTPRDDRIPFVYDSDIITGRVSATRSFGVDVKHDLQFGWEVSRAIYRTADLSQFNPIAVQEFRDTVVPVTDVRNGQFLQYHFYLNRFASLLDVETMSLQESFLLGPELYLRFSPALRAFGSTRDVFGYRGEVAYTEKLGTGFARLYLAGSIETAPNGSLIYDSDVHTGLRIVSPSLGIGRLIYDGSFLYRPHNFSNALIELGGAGRLRGYITDLFIGENLIASNVELRSRTFSLWTFQVGGALFYDVADVFDTGDQLRPKQGAGFGLRALFPQLGRAIMRVDWGFPLTPNAGATSVFDGLVLTFRQAFGVPNPTGTGVSLAP